jgi:hypothetical protein
MVARAGCSHSTRSIDLYWAFLLAGAGLLDGCRVATHWHYCDDFKSGSCHESSCGSQDFWSYGAQVFISQDAQWDAIAKFRINPRQPSLNYPGRVVLAQGTHHSIGEAQAFLHISIRFGPIDPSIKRANILNSGNVPGEFPSDNLGKTFG